MRKEIMIWIGAILLGGAIGKAGGLIVAFAISTPALLVYLVVSDQVRRLREYGQRIDHLYIVAIPEGLPDLHLGDWERDCVIVPHGQVMKHLAKHQKLLTKSGNQTGAEIRFILWRDGENINETHDEYKHRVINTISADKFERHSQLKNQDTVWYLTHHHHEGATAEWIKPDKI